MRSNADFEEFYNREIKSTIAQIEEQRKSIADKYSYKKYWRNLKWLLVLTVIGGIARAVAPERIPAAIGIVAAVMVAYAIIAAIYLTVKRNTSFKPVSLEYKKTVISKIVHFVNPALQYSPEQGLEASEFTVGELFESPSRFKTEDLVQGTVDGVTVRMADVVATKTKRSGSKGESETVTLFKGFYGIARFDQPFQAEVKLKPGNAAYEALEKLGGIAKKLLGAVVDSFMERMKLTEIQTGHAEFDKAYFVQSNEKEKALALLTPTLMQLILSFNKELAMPVALSFKGDQMHMAFANINMFEIHLGVSMTEKDDSKDYFRHLNLAMGLIEAVKSLK
ncbi:MAG TPA: DUF3137 domain-containing protein [Cyclobacteriaceae bacterium]|nr:DUF3137 domain-containing protein [Cyclobacteriaceae bacterium]